MPIQSLTSGNVNNLNIQQHHMYTQTKLTHIKAKYTIILLNPNTKITFSTDL